jgi:hypothetical protein
MMDFEKEMGIQLSRPDGREDVKEEGRRGPTMAVPPEPPAKDLPQSPTPSKPDPPSPIIGSPSQPPNRPLPPTPAAKLTGSLRIPQPSRSPPFRQQAPLSMNPPTRPGTAATQTSEPKTSLTFPGSTKRLSWASIVSRRPIKYGQGKHSRVELVPQPSDDPDDPLVCPAPHFEGNPR